MVADKRVFDARQFIDRRVDLNVIARGSAAGAIVGLIVIGGGARAVMRLVALIAGMQPSFTAAGTLGLLIMGVVIGVVLALVYLPVRRWVPFRWPVTGVLFGLVLACITVVPFFGDPGGEAALVSPWIGAGLFALLPLVFGLTLAATLEWTDRRYGNLVRRDVGLLWLAVYAVVFAVAFAGMMSVTESGRTPTLFRQMLDTGGVAFHAVRDVQSALFLTFMIAFFGLHMITFWMGAGRTVIQGLSLSQLMLAWLLVRSEPLWPWMADTPAGGIGEWAAWGVAAVGFVAGIGLMNRERVRQENEDNLWNWLIAGVALFVGGFLLAWLAVLSVPDLQLRQWTAAQTTLTVAPLLLPWLCLPAALVGAAWTSAGS